MSLILIAELSTNPGGDIALAEDMIRAAADNGATYAKTQAFEAASINPSDPQRDWLTQAALSRADHERLMQVCADVGIDYLSTPFDLVSLQMLREIGQTAFKIASSESSGGWWEPSTGETWFISWPWGIRSLAWEPLERSGVRRSHLTAIPLYPTPLEAVGRATLLDGYSDHCVGLSACMWAIAQGVQVLEAHIKLDGRGRNCVWDKLPQDFATLRKFSEDVETMRTGVSTQFRTRWNRRDVG